jgi:hypothetical protein
MPPGLKDVTVTFKVTVTSFLNSLLVRGGDLVDLHGTCRGLDDGRISQVDHGLRRAAFYPKPAGRLLVVVEEIGLRGPR